MSEEEARAIVGSASTAHLQSFARTMEQLDYQQYFSGYFEYIDAQFAHDIDQALCEFGDPTGYTNPPFDLSVLSASGRTVYRGHAARLLLNPLC